MRLTEEDRKLIKLIEKWGEMKIEDVQEWLEKKNRNSVVWRLNRLVKNEIIKREKLVFGWFVYEPTNYKGVDIANYEHDQIAKKLCLKLSKELDCDYLTSRELRSLARRDLGIAGLSAKIPDFTLIKNDKKIAVEIELTQKNLKRQRELIEKYINQLQKKEYMQVFYYCGSQAIKERLEQITIEKNVQNFIFIKLLENTPKWFE